MADVFLIPFEMAVKLGGVRSIMNAYQEIDGLPAAASHELLTEILRDRWGFDGVVVADYFSVAFLQSLHGAAADKAEAAQRALDAGLDVELPNVDCFPTLVESAALDRAVERVLRLKESLGLFDAQPEPPGSIDLDPPTHRAVARRVAERAITLLKNEGGLLPLASDGGSIALIGPNAESSTSVLGNYTFAVQVGSHHPDVVGGAHVVSIADGIRGAAPDVLIATTKGCDVVGDDRSGFDEATSAARSADVAVVVVGDQSGQFGAGTSGEGTDTDDLRLPGLQEELVEAVIATGTPTVVVLVTGRPYAIPTIAEQAAAIVASWLPGEEAGNAVADVLFGHVNPSGKTTVTWSRGAGQQPLYYNDKRLGRTGYSGSTTRPVFAFGHGLSYTTFDFSDLSLSSPELSVDGSVDIACTVRNTGDRAGDEIVQLYIHDVAASIARPVQELKGFARVSLDAGQRARVTFTLPADMLSFTGVDLMRCVEPGHVDIFIGSSSADIRLKGAIDVVGALRHPGEDRALFTPVNVRLLDKENHD
jgi:hypothetical protein